MTFTCEFCKKSFTDKSNLNRHQKTTKKCLEIQKQEAEKVMGMENELMEYFGYNRSQLHKTLVRDAYRQLRML